MHQTSLLRQLEWKPICRPLDHQKKHRRQRLSIGLNVRTAVYAQGQGVCGRQSSRLHPREWGRPLLAGREKEKSSVGLQWAEGQSEEARREAAAREVRVVGRAALQQRRIPLTGTCTPIPGWQLLV